MAFRTALRRTNFSSILISNKSPPFKSSFAPLISRFVCYRSSVPVVNSDEESCTINAYGGSSTRSEQFSIQRGVCDQYMENPFQLCGPRGAYEAKKVEDGMYLRMEMPGIEKEDVKVRVEYGNICIKGEGKEESMHEDIGRSYSADIEINLNLFHPQSIQAEMKNGVLRMVIPKCKTLQKVAGLYEIQVK